MEDTPFYITSLELHNELLENNKVLMELHREYLRAELTGNESLSLVALDSLKDLGVGLFNLTKWLSGNALAGFSKAIGAIGNTLTKLFANNKMLIKQINTVVSRGEDKEYKVKANSLKLITNTGEVGDIQSCLKDMLSFLEYYDKYSKDVLSHLDKKLLTARKLSKAKEAKDIFKITEEFEGLAFPKLTTTKDLPGNTTVEYTDTFSISFKHPEAIDGTLDLSKSAISGILVDLNKVNGYLNNFKTNYDNYLKFLTNWTDMVKTVSKNLGSLEGTSGVVMKEAEKLLEGDKEALLFYSGFTPRVVTYTDKYLHSLLGVFA